jgi:hypothetical protein
MKEPELDTLTDRQKEVIAMHQEWLQQPMTKQLRATLNKHEDNIARTVADLSMNMNVNDAHVRALAVSLKSAITIRTMIFDTKSFIKHL